MPAHRSLSRFPTIRFEMPVSMWDFTVAQICGTRWAVRLPHLDESFRVYDAPLTLLLWPRR